MRTTLRWILPLALALCQGLPTVFGADGNEQPDPARMRRGQTLYLANCSMCHQVTGRGSADAYPPLAKSDFLVADPKRSILAVVQGLKGKILVNDKSYDGVMPPAVLDDQAVADVLTFVYHSWGNPGRTFSADEVAEVRSQSEFKTFATLVAANAYHPLPPAPQGFNLRELLRLPEFCVRMVVTARGDKMYLLSNSGTVWRLDIATKKITAILKPEAYLDLSRGGAGALGLMLDSKNRLWISCNQRNDQTRPLITNEVTLFRTTSVSPEGDPAQPKPWYKTSYPYGIGPYNHGVSHMAIGPDGKLYVSSGSRTDGGEAGTDPRLGKMGEVDNTACLWRLDPESPKPVAEVIARGIRNAWSFAWNSDGQLFTVSNGPDAHAGEEMDWIRPEQNLHHGFPYQFEDWPTDKKAYPHTPTPPSGLSFANPVVNLGPAGAPRNSRAFTFHPHSSPAGMVWLDSSWPESVRNTFLVGRFGNLIAGVNDQDCGFDVLAMKLSKASNEGWESSTHTFLAPLGRPIDIQTAPERRIFVLEYTRPVSFKEQKGWLPGRILELTATEPGHN